MFISIPFSRQPSKSNLFSILSASLDKFKCSLPFGELSVMDLSLSGALVRFLLLVDFPFLVTLSQAFVQRLPFILWRHSLPGYMGK